MTASDPSSHFIQSLSRFTHKHNRSLTDLSWLVSENKGYPLPTQAKTLPRPLIPVRMLIEKSLKSSLLGQRSHKEICDWIAQEYPYYRASTRNWRSTVSHNLRLGVTFVETHGSEGQTQWRLASDGTSFRSVETLSFQNDFECENLFGEDWKLLF